MTQTTTTSGRAPVARSRITALDVLRGIAIIGIIPVNVQAISRWAYGLEEYPEKVVAWPDYFIELAITGRMMPLFALLFGIGFELFLSSAARRTERPRLVMLRRLVFLLVVGVLHFLVYPGEVLTFYALGAIIFLLPASFAPRWVAAAAGVVLLVGTLPISGPLKLPGLFLAGAAIARYDVIGKLQEKSSALWASFAAFVVAAGVATYFQLPEVGLGDFSKAGRVAGVFTMFALSLGVLLLMKSAPVARALEVVFAPLGRMAFSNYLGTTLLVTIFGLAVGAPQLVWRPEYGLYVSAVIAPLQWIFSTLWLKRFAYGPLEWVWRTATWWSPQPMRKAQWAAV